MKKYFLLAYMVGFMVTALQAQDIIKPEKTIQPQDKMVLRANTRDRVMISRGNLYQYRKNVRPQKIVTRRQQRFMNKKMLLLRQRRVIQQRRQQQMQRQMLQQRRIKQQQLRRAGKRP